MTFHCSAHGNRSSLSPIYACIAADHCLTFPRHLVVAALCFARANAGKRIAESIAIMAMTTSSSINVKPFLVVFLLTANYQYPITAMERRV